MRGLPSIPVTIVQDSKCALVSASISGLDALEAVSQSKQSDDPQSPCKAWANCEAFTLGDLHQLRRRRHQNRLLRRV